ncbi:hypothetical protein CCACVL1_14707 [Corchorus capsularis]|uniref:Uncharacterized protein n=2 Tax=Corchorus capsularis TaxID=210143 RepID=A0A1R3I646_COCAP|nr:hypothetical protein CCACVL1_14707 [Corchorus capsularis]
MAVFELLSIHNIANRVVDGDCVEDELMVGQFLPSPRLER